MKLTSLIVAAMLCLAPSVGGASDALPVPAGEVVLVVTGDIAVTNAEGAARFDMEMLRALGAESFTTSTIWTEGPQRFTGVSLHRLLARLGVAEGTIDATAINDYSVEIPVSDAVEGGPIIAFARNDSPMSVRDKGPLWVVYPYDSVEGYRTEAVYARSIWQLDRLHLRR